MTKSSQSSSTTTSNTAPSKTGDSQPAPEPKTGSSLDQLAERIGESELEPDLARQLAENWQKFFGAMVLVLLGVWLLGEFRAASRLEKEDASFRFQNSQDAYATLVGEDTAGTPEQQEKARSIFNENLALLEKGSSGSVYEKLAPLYRAQAAIDAGELDAAKAALSAFNVTSAANIPTAESVNSVEQFVAELAALQYARILTISADNREQQRNYVATLSERALFVNVESLLLLYRSAQSDAEKNTAKELAKKLTGSRPEIADAITTAFEGLGVAL